MCMRWRFIRSILLGVGAALLSSCALFDGGGPEARFDTSPVVVYVGDTVTFDAGASTGPASIVAYNWDLGTAGPSAGRTVTASYDAPGTYLIRLTIQDANGKTATLEQPLTVYIHSGTAIFQ